MNYVFLVIAALIVAGCGVKGDPMPPEKAAEIGRGRPTYKRAMKDIKVNTVNEDPEEEEVDKEDAE